MVAEKEQMTLNATRFLQRAEQKQLTLGRERRADSHTTTPSSSGVNALAVTF